MPLIDLQVRLRELGRIRTGITVESQSKNGKRFRRPEKLETIRLTSASESLIRAAAAIYGGEVAPWESPAGAQWEVVTKVDRLPIVIPSGQSLSQWYEMWAAGGCLRRCDGQDEQISNGPCLCPADPAERRELAGKIVPEACKPTTRLNVVLPDLPDLGVWRLESHGYYAAVELAGAAQFLAMASAAGMNIPASLRLEQREKKVPGRPTNRYAVPVIEFTTTRITDLLNAGAGPMMLGDPAPNAVPQLTAGSLAPDKPKRGRGQKVERPALGPAPEVPDGSGFGRRQPVASAAPQLPGEAPTAEAPAAAAQPVEPETVAGGWPLIDDAAPEPLPPVRRTRSSPPPPPPKTPDEIAELIRAMAPPDKERARAIFERRFPNVRNLSQLEPDALGRYWHEVSASARVS